MKKILFLGGSYFQLPPILYAKEQGHYVITCDYLPNNPGHQYADEYFDISTTDKESVLALAKKLRIDGVVAYASDPAAPTAAYVGNKLGLPSNPYESVLLLTRKELYRKFLNDNKFNTPEYNSFESCQDALSYYNSIGCDVIVKPVDSSGSKGVTIVKQKSDFCKAFDLALSFSREKKVIVETLIRKKGYQIAGDGFVNDGKLVFRCFANEHFNHKCNKLVPIGESFPLYMDNNLQERIHDEIQRLLTLLHMQTGALNFDIMVDNDDKIYLMEIGPRNGGNLIPEVIKYATGVDLIKYTVDAALGLDCNELIMKNADHCYSSYIIHSMTDGIYVDVNISDEIKTNIVYNRIYVKPGDQVYKYNGSHCSIGSMIIKHDNIDDMVDIMGRMDEHIEVRLK